MVIKVNVMEKMELQKQVLLSYSVAIQTDTIR